MNKLFVLMFGCSLSALLPGNIYGQGSIQFIEEKVDRGCDAVRNGIRYDGKTFRNGTDLFRYQEQQIFKGKKNTRTRSRSGNRYRSRDEAAKIDAIEKAYLEKVRKAEEESHKEMLMQHAMQAERVRNTVIRENFRQVEAWNATEGTDRLLEEAEKDEFGRTDKSRLSSRMPQTDLLDSPNSGPRKLRLKEMLSVLDGNADMLPFDAVPVAETQECERLIGNASYPAAYSAPQVGGTVVYGYGGGSDERSLGEKVEDWMHDNLPESVRSNRYFWYAEDAIRKVTSFSFGKSWEQFKNNLTDRALGSLKRSGKNALPTVAVRPLEAGETSVQMHVKVMNLLTDRKTMSKMASAAVNGDDAARKEFEANFQNVATEIRGDARRKASDMAGIPLPEQKDLTPERVTRNAARPIIREQQQVLREKGEKWIEAEFIRYSRP